LGGKTAAEAGLFPKGDKFSIAKKKGREKASGRETVEETNKDQKGTACLSEEEKIVERGT